MAKEGQYHWFVEPLDQRTSAELGREFGEENTYRQVRCADGKLHDLYACPGKRVRYLWESQESMKIKIRIFGSEGRSRKIYDKTFLFAKQQPKAQKLLVSA